MLMSGKRSTGMRTTLVIPITDTIRQITTMKYGLRMEKRDISVRPFPPGWRPSAAA